MNLNQSRQTKQLNSTPRINPLDLFSVYDDFSNGDLEAGNLEGTFDLKNNPRDVVDSNDKLYIQDSILQIKNSDVSSTKYIITYGEYTLPILLNYVTDYQSQSGFLHIGFASSPATRPSYGIRIPSNNTIYKWENNVATSLGISAVINEKVSYVLSIDSGGSCTLYNKTPATLYSSVATFSLSGYTTKYFGASFTNANSTPHLFYSIKLKEADFQSIGQLETLFPLI